MTFKPGMPIGADNAIPVVTKETAVSFKPGGRISADNPLPVKVITGAGTFKAGAAITDTNPLPTAGSSGGASLPVLAFASAVAQAEGNSGTTVFTFTLNLTRNGSTAAIPFTWAVTGTGANPAVAADFVGGVLPSGSGTFASGETTKTINVNVAGDSTAEANENFLVTASASLALQPATATGTITDDDTSGGDTTAPTITSSNPTATYAEGVAIAGTLTANEAVTWSKSGADLSRVTLNTSTGVWSLEATDFEAKSSYAWTFTATDTAGNATNQVVAITITDVDEIAPTLSSPTDTASGQTGASLSVTTSEAGGTLYWFVSTSSSPPSVGALKAGTGAVAYSSQGVSSAGVQNVTVSGLTAATAYYSYFLHRDAATNESSIAAGDGFTTAAAGGGAPANSVAPAITGDDYEGAVLTAGNGTWTNSPTFAKQWMRGTYPIPGAIGDTYTLARLDVGRPITCVVTATAGGQSVAATTSNSVLGKFDRDARIVWLGNSKDAKANIDSYRNATAVLTNGYFANGEFGNQARSGDDLTDYKDRWVAVAAVKPDLLILGDTTNETRTQSQQMSDIDDLLEYARAAGIVVIIERMSRLAGQTPGSASDNTRLAVIADLEARVTASASATGTPSKSNPSLQSPAIFTALTDQAYQPTAAASTSNPMSPSYDATHQNVIGAWGQTGVGGAAKAIADKAASLTSAVRSYVGTGQVAGNTHTTGWDVNGTGGTATNVTTNNGIAANYAVANNAGLTVVTSKEAVTDDQIIDISGTCSSHTVDAITFTRTSVTIGTRAVGDTTEFFYDFEITNKDDGNAAPVGLINAGIAMGSIGSIFGSTGTAPVYQQLGVAISAVTKANPCVVTTATSHGFADGNFVVSTVNSGMTQLNNTIYVVADKTDTTFALKDAVTGAYVDSSAWGTFTTTGTPKVGLLATLQVPIKGVARSQGNILPSGGVSANIILATRFRPGAGINCRIKIKRVMVRPTDATAYAAPYNQNVPGDGGLAIYSAGNVASPASGLATATFTAAPGNVSGGGFNDTANGGSITYKWKKASDNTDAPGTNTNRSYVPGSGNAGQYYCATTWTNALGTLTVNSTTITAT